jgi:hypothetical protein
MFDDDDVRFTQCKAIKETPEALLVYIDALDQEIWVPKSQITNDSEVYKMKTEGDLVVTRWFADKIS